MAPISVGRAVQDGPAMGHDTTQVLSEREARNVCHGNGAIWMPLANCFGGFSAVRHNQICMKLRTQLVGEKLDFFPRLDALSKPLFRVSADACRNDQLPFP